MANTYDVIVIGAGAAGLTVAGGAAMFGLKAALVEKGRMGGDCLNFGCVPSKALIAAAAHSGWRKPPVPFGTAMAHVRRAIKTLEPVDSEERFASLGVDVIRAHARFADDRTILAGERELHAPRFAIATGSRPKIPAIPGIENIPYLTSETLWDLECLPRHLAIIGAGPFGMEMAQAFRRLGAEVTVTGHGRPLSRDDPEAADLALLSLQAEGVRFELGASILSLAREDCGVSLTLSGGRSLSASHLLVAAGRRANVEGFGLERAGVRVGEDGIIADARCRTSNRRIFAAGDCCEGPRFTHVSGHEGKVALLNIALGYKAKRDLRALPRVTYTDPEIAQLGLTEAEARARYGDCDVVREDFSRNDRAVAEGKTGGFLKLVRRRGKVLGVTIAGERAGDLLLPWTLVMMGRASVFAIGSAIVPYPTRSDISRAAAFAAYEPVIFSRWTKIWARFLARMRR